MKIPPNNCAAQEVFSDAMERHDNSPSLFETIFVSTAGGATLGNYFGELGAIAGAIVGGAIAAFVVLGNHE